METVGKESETRKVIYGTNCKWFALLLLSGFCYIFMLDKGSFLAVGVIWCYFELSRAGCNIQLTCWTSYPNMHLLRFFRVLFDLNYLGDFKGVLLIYLLLFMAFVKLPLV